MTSRLSAICALLAAFTILTCMTASGLAGSHCTMQTAPTAAAAEGGCEHCAPSSMDVCVVQCLVIDRRVEIAIEPPTDIRFDVPPAVEQIIVGLAAEPRTPPPRRNFG